MINHQADFGEPFRMDRLRVLFLSPVPNFKGGAERSLMDLMTSPRIEPFLALPEEGPLSKRADELGVPWDVIDFDGISSVRRPFRLADGMKALGSLTRAARQLNSVARRRNIALVHSNGLKAHAIALTAKRIGGRPTVIHIRDIANTNLEKMVWKAFQLAADRTILVSRACVSAARLPATVHVVHNGLRSGFEHPKPEPREDIVLGFTAARIHPSKGLHFLLDSLAKARVLGCRARLIVRGAFAEETPAYRRQIESAIAVLKLSDVVSFENFVTDPERVYDGIDIVCVPSTMPDPFPRSVMEAMGRGLVVIATPCGGIPEMIADGETGFLASDPSHFAAVVLRLQNDPALRDSIGRQACSYSLSHFGLDRLHDEVRHVYQLAMRPS
jgi:glycosyltransferase involved in cell wall biosynthesis